MKRLPVLLASILILGYLGSNLLFKQTQLKNNQVATYTEKSPLLSKFDPVSKDTEQDLVQTTTIIFDLGETLLEQDHMKIASEIGLFDIMFYKNKDKLKDILFDVLYKLGHQEKITGELQAKSGENIVPGIVCHWFAGKISSQEILEKINNLIEELDKQNYFSSKTEKRIIKNGLTLMFDPEKLSKVTKPIKKSLKLIKQLYNAKDEKGNPLYELFILSNWDKESFEIFYNSKNGQKLFKYFKPENIIISGKIGQIKPHTSTFQHVINQLHDRKLINKNNLNNTNKIAFIDDQPENIEAAQKFKISGILFDKSNHNELVSNLEKLGIQPEPENRSNRVA